MNAKTHYTQPSLKADRARLGAGLFRLAQDYARGESTQLERENAIKAMKRRRKTLDGKSGVRYLREQIDAVSQKIRANRKARKLARVRGPYTLAENNAGLRPNACKPVRLDTRASEKRLRDRVARDVFALFFGNYRVDRKAGSESLEITRNPSDVGIVQTESLDWDYYSKATKYPKKIVDTDLTVPAAWWLRVRDQDLSIVDGMLTLDAQRAEGAPADVDLFAAVWLEQGRGYEIRAIRGYIARERITATSYHGADAAAALRGLNRKLGAVRATGKLQDLLAKHGIDGVVSRAPDLTVSLADARATGACEYGIRSWCNRTGLPYETGSAPLADVYAAYRAHPLPEARAAILHALRRQKRALLAAA
jgi:hypothetical protein